VNLTAGTGGRVVRVEAEVGSGMNGSRAKVRRLLADPNANAVVVEHRDRLGRMNTDLVEAALSAHGRRLVEPDDGEAGDDLVRDMVEVLTSFRARLYGRKSAGNRALKTVGCARRDVGPQAVLPGNVSAAATRTRPLGSKSRSVTPHTRRAASAPANSPNEHSGAPVARFEVPDGWSAQAFCFALDLSPEHAACSRRQFGDRRYARNWAVRTLKAGLDRYHAAGEETEKPSLAELRKRWNQVKDAECADAETGEV
jgi:hypothetical protein